MADFSDLGGTPVEENNAPSQGGEHDFSDLGGVPVSGQQTPLESAARGALRNFPFAQQIGAAITPKLGLADKTNYSDELKHLTEAAEAGKKQNPASYMAGATAGTLAPLAIPFVGEGLTAAPIAANAALGASQSISDTDLTNPTMSDAKQAAIAAGLGGGFGAIGKGLSALAPTAEELAASSTAKGLGATARNAGKIMGKNPDATMADIGNWINRVKTSDGESLVSMADRPGKIVNAVQDIHDSAGKTIGDILDKIAPDASIPKASITKDLYPLADELETLAPDQHAKVMGVINKINKLSDSGRLDLQALNKIKGFVGEEAQDNPTMSRVYGNLAESVNNIIDEYGRVIGDPKDRKIYEVARENYRNSSKIMPIIRRFEGRELAQGPMGNSGLLGLFGLASGVAAGHPIGGAAAALGSAVGRPLANMVGRNAALKMVPQMGKIVSGGRLLNKAAQLELANALQSKFGEKQ